MQVLGMQRKSVDVGRQCMECRTKMAVRRSLSKSYALAQTKSWPQKTIEDFLQNKSNSNQPAKQAANIDTIISPVQQDMAIMRQNLVKLAGDRHPMLVGAANQVFGAGGKLLRPALVFLVSKATCELYNISELRDKHRRLSEITEMIHVASLVHDDVLDEADTRRGESTVNQLFGTRVAVLVGDFLFAQASWYLAQLENLEVIKLISQVIADFADGEISQAQALYDTNITLEKYMDKSFWKTASLIAASCRSAAVFSDADETVKEAMYQYGKHLGLAFQVVDDVLDYTASAKVLGKPQGQDLASGNITAPAIFAMNSNPRLKKLLNGKMKGAGQYEEAMQIIQQSGGIQQARNLAQEEGDAALKALEVLPECEAKKSLQDMVQYVLQRLY